MFALGMALSEVGSERSGLSIDVVVRGEAAPDDRRGTMPA